MRSLLRVVWTAVLLGTLLMAAPRAGVARAQLQTTSPSSGQSRNPQPLTPGMDGPNNAPDPLAAQQAAGRARSLANDRQKRIVDDTAKLLQLATELKADVDKTTKNELSLDVVRKAEEIEKLAHDVKQRMKS